MTDRFSDNLAQRISDYKMRQDFFAILSMMTKITAYQQFNIKMKKKKMVASKKKFLTMSQQNSCENL